MRRKNNWKIFCRLYSKNFNQVFARSSDLIGKEFLQHGDSCQNSKVAKSAMEDVGVTLFTIPAGSRNLNPIENFFAAVHRRPMLSKKTSYEKRARNFLQESRIR